MISLFSRYLGGEGRFPLVVLHGMLGASRNWLSTGAALAEHWSVSALDLRNHGKSPHAEEMNYEVMVGDVLRWLDQNGLHEIDLMGHSMGGKLAMLLACRHPDRVRRLMVVDIAPRSYFSNGHRVEFTAMHELPLRELKSRAEAELKMEGRVPDWGMRKFITTNLERNAQGDWRWIINLPVISRAIPDLEQNPLAEADRFLGPTLFVMGGKSRYVRPEDHETIRHYFPAADIEIIPDSGHNPHMESRAAFVRCVLDHALA